MFALLASLLRPPVPAMEIREVRTPTTPMVGGAKAATKSEAAAAVAAAPAQEGGAQVKDSFVSKAPPKPMQQGTLISPITVAKMSMASAQQVPRELLASVASHIKGTQKKVGDLIPKQAAEAAKQPKGKKKGGGRRGGKSGGSLFDDGAES